MWLAKDAIRRGLVLWHVVSKHHYFFHMGLQCYEANPRTNQTYLDESFVGRIAEVYKGSLNGPHARTVQRTVAQKWLMGLMCDFILGGGV